MTETAEVTASTPEVNTNSADTSVSEVSTQETTSQTEPNNGNTTAETGTEAQTQEAGDTTNPNETNAEPEKLYANKYKSVEELEKGYSEAQKTLTQNAQYKSKYEELLKQQEAQQAIQLEKAKQQGFQTVEAQEVAQQTAVAEFNAYWNSLNLVGSENSQTVKENLQAYYNTGNVAYLEEAKRYYPSDFIENVAIYKQQMKNDLNNRLKQKEAQARSQREQELANVIRNDFAEFLTDLETNGGKAQALKAFCNANFIQSREDMQEFQRIYSLMAKHERELAIKEYEAKKVIDETKNKASIDTTGNTGSVATNKMPTRDDLIRNPDLYEKTVKEYVKQGMSTDAAMSKVDEIIMKG